jgi:hypothetical protein
VVKSCYSLIVIVHVVVPPRRCLGRFELHTARIQYILAILWYVCRDWFKRSLSLSFSHIQTCTCLQRNQTPQYYNPTSYYGYGYPQYMPPYGYPPHPYAPMPQQSRENYDTLARTIYVSGIDQMVLYLVSHCFAQTLA